MACPWLNTGRRVVGMTLVELLVVLTIIAILAGLVLPSLYSARERGLAVSCLSNVRQLTTGTVSYMQDHKDQFPMYSSG